MAGDWIPYLKALPRKPKTLRVKRLTGLSLGDTVFGLLELWAWADEQTEDGSLAGLTLDDLSAICPQTVGETSALRLQFVQAVASVGWLVIDADGVTIPQFARWMGNSAKRRLQETSRKRHNRSALPPVRKPSAKRPQTVRELSAPAQAESGTTGQDRTEQKKNTPLPPPAIDDGLPGWLRSEAFGHALARWLAYRRQIRKPLKDVSVQALLKQLAPWGEAGAVASIDKSIANGWQGLFEPKGGPGDDRDARLDRLTFPDDPPKAGGKP